MSTRQISAIACGGVFLLIVLTGYLVGYVPHPASTAQVRATIAGGIDRVSDQFALAEAVWTDPATGRIARGEIAWTALGRLAASAQPGDTVPIVVDRSDGRPVPGDSGLRLGLLVGVAGFTALGLRRLLRIAHEHDPEAAEAGVTETA